MSGENTEKKRPVIKGYGYDGQGDDAKRFELALWDNANGKGYSGEFRGKKVVAFRDVQKADGSPASPSTPLKLYERPADKDEKIDWSKPMIELFPTNNDRRPTIGNAEQDVFVTVLEGNQLVGVRDAKPEEAQSNGM